MIDHEYYARLLEQDGYRDWLAQGLDRLEEALLISVAGHDAIRGSAILRLANIWEQSDPPKLVEWLYRCDFSEEDQRALYDSLSTVRAASDSLKPRQRDYADRALYRLLHKIPVTLTEPLVAECVRGSRKRCRNAGYRALRAHGTPSQFAALLWERHLQTGDKEPLNLIACSPEALAVVSVSDVISRIREKYYRARLVESLIRANDSRLDELLPRYVVEFAWACGRVANPNWIPKLRQVAAENMADPELIWSTMWAMSKMPIVYGDDVAFMRQAVESLLEQRPPVDERLAWFRRAHLLEGKAEV